MTYDIVVPHYGKGRLTELCKRCLETVRDYSADYRLIFVDNGSPEFPRIYPELRQHRTATVLRNTKNVGFVRAVNQGIAMARAPYVVLLNNDAEAVPGWLEALRAPLDAGAALSGPRTTAAGSWQGRTHAGPGWEFLHSRAMLAFFCTMFRREVFEQLGALDEDFGPGLGDDDHFCWLAQRAGMRLALVRSLVIPHHHRSTFKEVYGSEAIPAMQERAMALFREKSSR